MEKSSYIYEKFATDLETDSAKAKKKDILGIFENYNSLRSETEYKRIEFGLHEAWKKGDFELIKIFLNETIKNESPSLAFKIDKANKTASLMNNYNDSEFLVIPRTVKHESTDYLITSICIFKNWRNLFSSEFEWTKRKLVLWYKKIEKNYNFSFEW